MYDSKRNKPKVAQITYYSVSVIILFWLFSTLRNDEHVPFPTIPKIPAHVPFKREATWNPNKDKTAFSKYGMVASDSEYCSELGVKILQRGGNAADAAITTCLCIGATDTMFSSGIGGGAFITSKRFDGAISIDAREMAPGSASTDMFKDREDRIKYGGLASGIPGELMGLWKLYKLHGSGTLKWADLVLPIAELVERGWKVDKRLAYALQGQLHAFKYFRKDWDFVFKDNSNTLLGEGDLIKRRGLAKTLRYIAKHGALSFYDPNDYISKSISAKVQEWEGILTPKDFGMYDVIVERALELNNFTDRNLTVYSANGASSGLALISGLSILNQMNEFECDGSNLTSIETHKLAEVMKWMAATRSYLGDIGIYNKNESELIEKTERYSKFLSQDYIDGVLSKINDNKTYSWQQYNPAYEPNDPHGTSSLSVTDIDGNAVVLTTTINLLFGSCVHDPETGVIMNNEMDDFSLPHTKNSFGLQPSIYNYIQAYKRPLSSSAQTIIVNSENNLELVIGAAGGSRITNAILEGILRILLKGKNITNAIANPRIHHQLLPEILYIENPMDGSMVEDLQSKGHHIEYIPPQSAMNAIRVTEEGMWGQSDWWRKFGVAVGV